MLLLTPRSDDGKPWASETLRAAEPIEPLAVPAGRPVRTHMRAPTPAPVAGGRTTHPDGYLDESMPAPCDETVLLRESIEVRSPEVALPCMLGAVVSYWASLCRSSTSTTDRRFGRGRR